MLQKPDQTHQNVLYKLEVKEKHNYVSRIKRGYLIASLLFIVFTIVGYVYTNSIGFLTKAILFGAVTTAIIIYLEHLNLNPSHERYFITMLEFTDSSVHVEYKDKMTPLELTGGWKDFNFQKRWTSHIRSPERPFLQIMYKKRTIITQYRKYDDWSEDKIDEIMNIVKKYGLNSE